MAYLGNISTSSTWHCTYTMYIGEPSSVVDLQPVYIYISVEWTQSDVLCEKGPGNSSNSVYMQLHSHTAHNTHPHLYNNCLPNLISSTCIIIIYTCVYERAITVLYNNIIITVKISVHVSMERFSRAPVIAVGILPDWYVR